MMELTVMGNMAGSSISSLDEPTSLVDSANEIQKSGKPARGSGKSASLAAERREPSGFAKRFVAADVHCVKTPDYKLQSLQDKN
jgi:hypothetical protein